MRKAICCSFVLFVSILMSALFCGCNRQQSQIAADELTGNRIVVALNTYKKDRGSYPDVLRQIVPDYIEAIPPPTYGKKSWDYKHYADDDSFALIIWGRDVTDDFYSYSTERRKWERVKSYD